MQPSPTQPICPSCAYDLSGIIEPESAATCPECNTESTFESATTIHSRKRSIKTAANLLLAIPLPLTALSYFLYINIGYKDGEAGLLIVALLFYHISITTIVLLVKEFNFRKRMKHAHISPSGWISVLWIILPATLSMSLSQYVLMLWAAWIASV